MAAPKHSLKRDSDAATTWGGGWSPGLRGFLLPPPPLPPTSQHNDRPGSLKPKQRPRPSMRRWEASCCAKVPVEGELGSTRQADAADDRKPQRWKVRSASGLQMGTLDIHPQIVGFPYNKDPTRRPCLNPQVVCKRLQDISFRGMTAWSQRSHLPTLEPTSGPFAGKQRGVHLPGHHLRVAGEALRSEDPVQNNSYLMLGLLGPTAAMLGPVRAPRPGRQSSRRRRPPAQRPPPKVARRHRQAH